MIRRGMQRKPLQITPVFYWACIITAAVFAYVGASIIASAPSRAVSGWFMLVVSAYYCVAAAWLFVHRGRYPKKQVVGQSEVFATFGTF